VFSINGSLISGYASSSANAPRYRVIAHTTCPTPDVVQARRRKKRPDETNPKHLFRKPLKTCISNLKTRIDPPPPTTKPRTAQAKRTHRQGDLPNTKRTNRIDGKIEIPRGTGSATQAKASALMPCKNKKTRLPNGAGGPFVVLFHPRGCPIVGTRTVTLTCRVNCVSLGLTIGSSFSSS